MYTPRPSSASARVAIWTAAVCLVLAGCSGTGTDDGKGTDAAGGSSGPRIALITHGGEGDAFWDRFHSLDDTLWYYGALADILSRKQPGPMTEELEGLVAGLRETAEVKDRRKQLSAAARAQAVPQ